MATTPYKQRKFRKMGYEAFRAKDVNKDGSSLARKLFPDILTKNHPVNEGLPENEKVMVFDHSLQTVDLYEKLSWARGWEKARKEYVNNHPGNMSVATVKAKMKRFFAEDLGVSINRQFSNSLYMRFTIGSKATFKVNLLK